jgi:hypothetical protein
LNIFKNIFPQKNKTKYYNGIFSNTIPIYSTVTGDIYLSDFVNNAIDRIATEISKIELKSIVEFADSTKIQNDDITRLFRFKPNPIQTTKDFFANVEWLRRKNFNAFIYPQYEIQKDIKGNELKKYTAFFPLNPTSTEIGVSDEQQIYEVRFYFEDGSSYTLPYSELIHLKWRRGVNPAYGGNELGRAENKEMIASIQALEKTINGLPKSIEASLGINGVYAAKSVIDRDKLEAEKDKFEEHIFRSKTGIIATDLSGDFTPVNINSARIDPGVLAFMKSVLYERYGISSAILSGDYSGDQHSAFYQTCLEDFIVEFEQSASSILYSQREQDIGHRIRLYYNKVAYLSFSNKLEMANYAKDTGNMTINQVNSEIFGIAPFEGGDLRLRSLNYVNSNIADDYQLGQKTNKVNEGV